jgi:hypothetical protein
MCDILLIFGTTGLKHCYHFRLSNYPGTEIRISSGHDGPNSLIKYFKKIDNNLFCKYQIMRS